MNNDLWLGIDVGTSSVKSVLLDSLGLVVGRGTSTYPTSHPKPRRSEQRPEHWWSAVSDSVQMALASSNADPARVKAMAMSTQGGTLAPVDAAGVPTHSAIVWTDTRCAKQAQAVDESLTKEYVYRTTGWALNENLNFLQTLWLQDEEPEVVDRTAKFLSVHDYLALRLTGNAVLDMSNGGVNQFLNLRTGEWDEALLQTAGISADQLGTLLPPGESIGTLLPSAATDLGLLPGTRVINGAHDQYCVAYGVGAVSPGDVFIGSGTAWVVGAVETDLSAAFSRGKSASLAVPHGTIGSMISLEAGGASLEWWGRVGSLKGDTPTWEEVDNVLLQRGYVAPEGLPVFLPYLFGNTYPRNDAQLRGLLWGLDAGHDAYAIAAGVMMGVASQAAWMLEAFPSSSAPLTLVGGAANSQLWTQYLANACGRDVLAALDPDVGALGAAMLAAHGLTGDEPPRGALPTRRTHPDNDREAWKRATEKFRRLSAAAAEFQDAEKQWTNTEQEN